MNPSAMEVDKLALVMSQISGRAITPEMISADISDGAPTNDDGTINLVSYTAWLARRAITAGV